MNVTQTGNHQYKNKENIALTNAFDKYRRKNKIFKLKNIINNIRLEWVA